MAKSITVKIGADTQDFIKGLKQVDKEIIVTQKTADNLTKSLKLEFSPTKFVQAQKQFQSALEQTEGKAETLRKKLREMESAGRVDTIDYSTLQLELAKTEAKATDLKVRLKELDDIKLDNLTRGVEEVGKKAENIGNKLRGVSLGAGGILAGMGAISKTSATLGAELDDLSLRFDVSAETIQEWQYLAVQCGVESDVFTKALVKMRAAMADLSTGTSNNATKILQGLGITPDQFKTQEEMFNGIVAALASVEDATLQTAYANEIFGDKIATQMLPYINTGTETIKKFKDEFAAMPSLSNEQVASLAELDDTYYRLTTSMRYATAQMGVALVPVMERGVEIIENTFVPALEKLGEWFDSLSPSMQNMLVGGLGILALASPTFMFIGKMSTGISSLIKLFHSLNAAQLKMAAGFAAIAGAAALGLDIIVNWKKMSALEVLLKGLGVAALAAAAAMAVFHASWSVGLAVAAIGAAVAGALALIKSATKDIYPDENVPTDVSGIESEGGNYNFNPEDYTYPKPGGGGNSYSDTTYNDSYNITISVTQPGASAEEIAAAVSKEIATLAQSRG